MSILLRRYGNTVQSVVPNFDSRALSEISFRRDRAESFSIEEFESGFEKLREEELGGETEGAVQSEAEEALLHQLEQRISRLLSGLSDNEVALVENEQGVDYPKVRDRKRGIIVEGENRLHFEWRVDPPLRIGLYRRTA